MNAPFFLLKTPADEHRHRLPAGRRSCISPVSGAALLAVLALASNTQALTVSGTYNVSGTESHVGIFVGVSSTGTLNVSAGNTLNASGKFFINGNDGSGGYPNSAVNVNGGTLNYTNPSGEGFQVGWWYGGHFNVSGGLANMAKLGIYDGDVTVSGGTLNVLSENVVVATIDDFNNVLTISGGIANLRGVSMPQPSLSGLSPGEKLVLTGGTLNLGVGGITGHATSVVEFGGGTVGALANWSSSKPITLTGTNGNVTFDPKNSTITLSNVLSSTGGLVVAATGETGTVALSAANTYTGTTTVSAGTLALRHVNAVQSSTLDTGIAGAQIVTFTVAGTNTYNLGGLQGAADLNAEGNSLSIGANHASTTSTGDITSAAVAKVGAGTLDLNGANQNYHTLTAYAGTTNVNGALTTLTADVTVNNGGTKLCFGGVSQTIGSLSIGAGATVVFTSGVASGAFSDPGKGFGGAALVPEPGTFGLLLIGALGVLHRRRRQA